jgi:hypothetical protein
VPDKQYATTGSCYLVLAINSSSYTLLWGSGKVSNSSVDNQYFILYSKPIA